MSLQKLIERIILASRWLLVVFYLGLAVALAFYAASFVMKVAKIGLSFHVSTENDLLLEMLKLIDAALVAGLVVMVMLSSYDNFVSRLDNGEEGGPNLGWLSGLDPGNLKIKVASAIVAISSIHLLQVFLNINSYTNAQVGWLVAIHLAFVGSALFLGVLDRIMSHGPGKGSDKPGGP